LGCQRIVTRSGTARFIQIPDSPASAALRCALQSAES
jgi:hypothetical protein